MLLLSTNSSGLITEIHYSPQVDMIQILQWYEGEEKDRDYIVISEDEFIEAWKKFSQLKGK